MLITDTYPEGAQRFYGLAGYQSDRIQ